jgi:hypothetical protein
MSIPRVAVVICGHLCTWVQTKESFIKNVQKPLQADVFLHIYDQMDFRDGL